MPGVSSAKDNAPSIKWIILRLENKYGRNEPGTPISPLDELVLTILSQNTNDINRDRAWKSLKKKYKSWPSVLTADKEDLARAIRVGGLALIKAGRIQNALRNIEAEHGELSLDFLGDWPVEKARKYLLEIEGVGPKTAACVLLFSLGKPVFPVDTHIHRAAKRLGLIPLNASREKAHTLLEPMVPKNERYSLHINIINLGREICRVANPKCTECPLKKKCLKIGV